MPEVFLLCKESKKKEKDKMTFQLCHQTDKTKGLNSPPYVVSSNGLENL